MGMLAMFFNYSLKLRHKSFELEKQDRQQKERIKVLEKKNGSEQKQINQLKEEVSKLKEIIKKYDKN
jgi:uncharacterized protein YlxW (UPF0749 family)